MADILDPTKGTRENTNIFHFSFKGGERPLRIVVPKTYSEAMKFIDGQRKFHATMSKGKSVTTTS